MKLVISFMLLLTTLAAKSQQHIKVPCIDCDTKQIEKVLSDVATLTSFTKVSTTTNKGTGEMIVTFINANKDTLVAIFGSSAMRDKFYISRFYGPHSALVKLDKDMLGRQTTIDGEKADYWNCIFPNGQNGFVHLIPSPKMPGKWVLKLG